MMWRASVFLEVKLLDLDLYNLKAKFSFQQVCLPTTLPPQHKTEKEGELMKNPIPVS